MKVPYFKPHMGDDEVNAVSNVIRSGWLTTGKHARAFEEEFAQCVGAKHAIALNSCTAGLHLGLDALGLKRGDVVMVPSLTFAATAEVVRYFDAHPLLVDSDPETLCMCPESLRKTLEKVRDGKRVPGFSAGSIALNQIKGVVPVHFAGQMADMESIHTIASEYNLFVMEDAAHCMPAQTLYHGEWKSCGQVSGLTAFSFYANKCITTGEGGMLVCDDDDVAARVRRMSLHGLSKDAWKRFDGKSTPFYDIVEAGYKYNLTDIAAALGRVQLDKHKELHQLRIVNAKRYDQLLSNHPFLDTPVELETKKSSWHLYVVRLKGKAASLRDSLISELQDVGVGTSVHYRPLHAHQYYRENYEFVSGDFPIVDEVWPRMLSLPLFAGMTERDSQVVVDELSRALEKLTALES